MSWLHLAVLVFASFRLTHLIVFDKVTWFLRKHFLNVVAVTDETGKMTHQIEIRGTGLRRKIGSLLVCHWCVGIWSSLLLISLLVMFPVTFYLDLVLAVAGMSSLVEFYIVKK